MKIGFSILPVAHCKQSLSQLSMENISYFCNISIVVVLDSGQAIDPHIVSKESIWNCG